MRSLGRPRLSLGDKVKVTFEGTVVALYKPDDLPSSVAEVELSANLLGERMPSVSLPMSWVEIEVADE